MITNRRSVVITGASRGLGSASAAQLYRTGWTVLAAMRTPEEGLARLRLRTGAVPDDPRLLGVRLDLDDPASITAAAHAIQDAVGAPDGLVHNAGVAAVGSLEELPMSAWEQILSTNLLGPVRLTKELLPAMRAAGRGRIVVVSSEGAVRGMPAVGAYSAAKSALERWAESLAHEIAPFGLGVSVLVAGMFKTEMLELTRTYADPDGPYARHHSGLERSGRALMRFAAAPERFALAVENALHDDQPFRRRAVGIDAHLLLWANRLVSTRLLQRVIGRVVGVPRAGALRRFPSAARSVDVPLNQRSASG